jgi:hypothetical protein
MVYEMTAIFRGKTGANSEHLNLAKTRTAVSFCLRRDLGCRFLLVSDPITSSTHLEILDLVEGFRDGGKGGPQCEGLCDERSGG